MSSIGIVLNDLKFEARMRRLLAMTPEQKARRWKELESKGPRESASAAQADDGEGEPAEGPAPMTELKRVFKNK